MSRNFLHSFLAGLGMFGAVCLVEHGFAHSGLPGSGTLLDDLLLGIFAAFGLFFLLRRLDTERELRRRQHYALIISELNHHIRNALQIIIVRADVAIHGLPELEDIFAAADRIERELTGAVEMIRADDLETAVREAFKRAVPGDVVLLAPGLSVIVHAIRQAREIFARMTSYATYRIAETIRVLLLITLAIVAFNFFPVTPVMIVFLAVLNDGAILSIAYDHVRGSDTPAAWDMRTVLVVATCLGVMGVAETFALFAIASQVLGLSHAIIRTLIYLKLSVSGHLTIFVTRTRGPFWTRPAPAPILLGAVIGTQLLATGIAVYGLLMTPLGWAWAGLVWAYALLWFLVEDRVKLAAYWWLGRHPARMPAAADQAS